MADRVVHFEITADDPERAAEFYRRSFGWSINNWGGLVDYWLVSSGDGAGIDGAITARAHGQAVINTIQVEGRLEDAIALVVDAGGSQVGAINPIAWRRPLHLCHGYRRQRLRDHGAQPDE